MQHNSVDASLDAALDEELSPEVNSGRCSKFLPDGTCSDHPGVACAKVPFFSCNPVEKEAWGVAG